MENNALGISLICHIVLKSESACPGPKVLLKPLNKHPTFQLPPLTQALLTLNFSKHRGSFYNQTSVFYAFIHN